MTDIRRTVLWVVFTMSLVLLWDGWQKHNGHPSMFSPAAPKPVATAGSAPAAVPAAAGGLTAQAAAPATSTVAAAPSETFTIKTDVLTVTLDSRGGDVTRVELPKFLNTPEQGWTDPLLQADRKSVV